MPSPQRRRSSSSMIAVYILKSLRLGESGGGTSTVSTGKRSGYPCPNFAFHLPSAIFILCSCLGILPCTVRRAYLGATLGASRLGLVLKGPIHQWLSRPIRLCSAHQSSRRSVFAEPVRWAHLSKQSFHCHPSTNCCSTRKRHLSCCPVELPQALIIGAACLLVCGEPAGIG
jgi:hypothetical protein